MPPPTDWSSTFAGTELAGAVASAKRAPGAAVNAGQARASSKECAYEWLHDAFGRRRIDAEEACDVLAESSATFASTLIRETVSNLRSSVTAHVYWTVLDDSRTDAAANMMKAFETIARPSSQPTLRRFWSWRPSARKRRVRLGKRARERPPGGRHLPI